MGRILAAMAGLALVAAPFVVAHLLTMLAPAIADTRVILAAAPAPKELWEIADAGHYDFERHAPEAWRRRVLGFLSRRLNER